MSCKHLALFSCPDCIKMSIREHFAAEPRPPYLHERISAFEAEIASLKAQLAESQDVVNRLGSLKLDKFDELQDENIRLRAQLDEAMRGLEACAMQQSDLPCFKAARECLEKLKK